MTVLRKQVIGVRTFIVLSTVFTVFTCIDPYKPNIGDYPLIMVIDGLITNENRSYTVKLSYTTQEIDSVAKTISDARVSISDEAGNVTNLNSVGNGVYQTDSLSFTGVTGKSYQLHIVTAKGEEYASDTCKMLPVTGIDSLYYMRDEQLMNNQRIKYSGISIFLNTKKGDSGKNFLRWEYNETWKFLVPLPTSYNYINDSNIVLLSPSDVHDICWRSARSTEVITGSIINGINERISGKPLTFIAPELSNRLQIRYSILVKQYSVSLREYNYWNNLKKMSETQGDIFGSQPFAVLSNVKNINDPEEQVLGYFQVSSAEQKRMYINFMDLVPLNIPIYHYGCIRVEMNPSRFPKASAFAIPPTFDEIYQMYINTGWAFVMPVYKSSNIGLDYLVFSSKTCANCELTGTSNKPDFWKDE